jgi:hypothetical protein
MNRGGDSDHNSGAAPPPNARDGQGGEVRADGITQAVGRAARAGTPGPGSRDVADPPSVLARRRWHPRAACSPQTRRSDPPPQERT